MRVFVTGASGFVGSAIVQELLQAGHQVLGLARTDSAAEKLVSAGAEVHRGDLNDLESLKKGTAHCDAVIHTAFNHDFSRYNASCEEDRQVILTLGAALAGTGRPLVITSGIGLLNHDKQSAGLLTEKDVPANSAIVPRSASEEAANMVAAQGVPAYIVRLPPTVHDAGDHGFIPMVIGAAREKGVSVYINEGENRWAAVHRRDAAALYRLIVEKQPAQKVFHAVAEEGIPFRQIATTIAEGLQLPVERRDQTGAEAHFGWFVNFAGIDCPASSELTRKISGWSPVHATLFEDLVPGVYF